METSVLLARLAWMRMQWLYYRGRIALGELENVWLRHKIARFEARTARLRA